MHEISLAGGILRMVEEAAAREKFQRISQLHLEVGALAGVEAHALRFALTAIAPGTCIEGGVITIDEVLGTAQCLHCAARVKIASHLDACSQCGEYTLQATGGFDVRVADLVVFNE